MWRIEAEQEGDIGETTYSADIKWAGWAATGAGCGKAVAGG